MNPNDTLEISNPQDSIICNKQLLENTHLQWKIIET